MPSRTDQTDQCDDGISVGRYTSRIFDGIYFSFAKEYSLCGPEAGVLFPGCFADPEPSIYFDYFSGGVSDLVKDISENNKITSRYDDTG